MPISSEWVCFWYTFQISGFSFKSSRRDLTARTPSVYIDNNFAIQHNLQYLSGTVNNADGDLNSIYHQVNHTNNYYEILPSPLAPSSLPPLIDAPFDGISSCLKFTGRES